MNTQIIQIKGQDAPLRIWPAAQESTHYPIHFAHGNGFPAGTYDAMLSELASQHAVYALDHRATWLSNADVKLEKFSWAHAADDMIAAIEQFAPQGVIGVGHSLGGVMTLLAASRRPDLFKQIILIEPVLFPTRMFLQMGWMPMAMRFKAIPLAKRTLQRRDTWRSREEFVDYHIGKSAFKGISREVMADYAEHGLRESNSEDGLELSFPKLWEAHIFRSVAYPWRALETLKVPCVCLRAEKSDWIPTKSWVKWQKMRPDYPIQVLSHLGHMAPLQSPSFVAREIQKNILSI